MLNTDFTRILNLTREQVIHDQIPELLRILRSAKAALYPQLGVRFLPRIFSNIMLPVAFLSTEKRNRDNLRIAQIHQINRQISMLESIQILNHVSRTVAALVPQAPSADMMLETVAAPALRPNLAETMVAPVPRFNMDDATVPAYSPSPNVSTQSSQQGSEDALDLEGVPAPATYSLYELDVRSQLTREQRAQARALRRELRSSEREATGQHQALNAESDPAAARALRRIARDARRGLEAQEGGGYSNMVARLEDIRNADAADRASDNSPNNHRPT